MRAANAVADGVEFDVRETRDGVLVLNHDPDAFGYRVARTDFRTLREASEQAGTPIATLEEAIAVIKPGKFVFAEVKVVGIAKQVVDACLPKFGPGFRIGSFSFSYLGNVPKELRWLIVNHPAELEPYRAQVRGVSCRANTFAFAPAKDIELAAWSVTPSNVQGLVMAGAIFLIADDPEGCVA